MDSIHIAQETINITAQQSQINNHSKHLVFLEESKQVVCSRCYAKYYKRQHSRAFNFEGNCQCLISDDNKVNIERFKLVAEYCTTSDTEIKQDCLYCIQEKDLKLLNIMIKKGKMPHKCKKIENSALISKSESLIVCGRMFDLNLNKRRSSIRNKSRKHRNYHQELSGFEIHLERYNCTLSHLYLNNCLDKQEKLKTIACLTTLIISQVPWIKTSPNFLFMIPNLNRIALLKKLKSSFYRFAKQKHKVFEFVLNLIRENYNTSDFKLILLLLNDLEKIKVLMLLINTKRELKFNGFILNLVVTQVLEMKEKKWQEIDESIRNDLGKNISVLTSEWTESIQKWAYHNKLKDFRAKLPTCNIKTSFKDEEELTSLSDKLDYITKEIIYGDISLNNGLDLLSNNLSYLETLLSKRNTVGLPGVQNARLFYSTPLVNTILIVAQIIQEEYSKAIIFKQNFDQFEKILCYTFSVMHELAKDSYDVCFLWISNYKSIVKRDFLTQKVVEAYEKLFSYVFQYLFYLNSDVLYREIILNLQLENGFHKYKSRIITKFNNYNRNSYDFDKNKVPFYMLRKFYPQEHQEEIKHTPQIFTEMNVSKEYALKCFILPFINSDFTMIKSLLGETESYGKSMLDYKSIVQILNDQDLENEIKIKLASHFLLGEQRIPASEISLNLLNSLGNKEFDSYKDSYLEISNSRMNLNSINLNFKFRVTEEIAEIWGKFNSITKGFLEGNNNIYSKVQMFSKVSNIVNQNSKELYFYSLTNLNSLHFHIIKEIKNKCVFGGVSSKIEKEQWFAFENELEMKKKLKKLSEELFTRHEKAYIAEDFRVNRLSTILHYKNEFISHKCFVKCVDFLKECTFLNISFGLEMLINSVSKEQSFPLTIEDLQLKLSDLSKLFIDFFLQYHSSKASNPCEEVIKVYFESTMKILTFFRILVDSNRMEMRKLLSEQNIELEVRLTISNEFIAKNRIYKLTFLILLVKCSNNIVNSPGINNERQVTKDDIELVLSIIDLISEIIEGNSSESIDAILTCFEYNNKGISENIKEIEKHIEDFYIKLYSERNITDKQKEVISKRLDNKSLIERVKALKEISNIGKILEDDNDKKIDRLVNFYYSIENNNLHLFRNAFGVFVFLKFQINYDLTSCEDYEKMVLIVELLEKVIKRIDVKIDNNPKEIFFLTSPESKLLSKESRETFIEQIDRSSTSSKNEDTIDYAIHYREEIKYVKEELMTGWKKKAANLNLKWLTLLCLTVGVMSVYLMLSYADVNTKELDDSVKTTFLVFLLIQILLSSVIFFVWLAIKFHLVYSLSLMKYRLSNNIEIGKETKTDKLKCKFNVITSSVEPICVLIIATTDILALINNSLYWTISLQLLCFVNFSKNLLNITKAIKLRSKQLGLISVFLIVLVLISSLLTFNYMSDSFQTEDGDLLCLTLGHCVVSQLDFGFRMGGGMGDNMPVQEWQSNLFWWKFFYSMTHYILFPVIMLNVVAGIIIDTFADLREQTSELENDKNTVCLVCGGIKDQIKKEEGSFNNHIKKKHNVFDYILFIKYILDTPEEKQDYFETQIRQQIENNQINWFPSNEEDMNSRINELEINILKHNQDLIKKVKEEVNKLREEFKSSIKGLENKMTNQFLKLTKQEIIIEEKLENDKQNEVENINEKIKVILPEIDKVIDYKEKKFCSN